MMMAFQDTMRQIAMSQQFNGTLKLRFQPLGGDFRIRMVIQCAVHAGHTLHVLQNGADVMTHQDDGTFLVDFLQ